MPKNKKVIHALVDTEYVKNVASKALTSQFETYSWEQVLEACEFTPAQLAWTKKHLDYKLVEI